VENLRSDVRRYPDLHLKRYLWPEAQMTTTRRGLQLYRGLYYMGEALRQQSWFAEALHRKQLVDVRYHPSETGSAIALPTSARGDACELSLTRRSSRFGGGTFSELAALELQKKTQNAAAAWANLPIQLAATKRNLDEGRSSRLAAEKAKPPGETVAERTRDIRQNREDELHADTLEVFASTNRSVPPDPSAPPAAAPSMPEDDASARAAEHVRRLLGARRTADAASKPETTNDQAST
jgi:hypothetical protein